MTKSYSADLVGNHLIAEASITGANSFTEATVFDPRRPFNASVSGTFSATVALQRSFDAGVTWLSVWTTTTAAEIMVDTIEEDIQWRLGVRTGDYTSGTIVARVSQ
jgi:hypothetical protein